MRGMELRDPTHVFAGEISPGAHRIATAISLIFQPFFVPILVFAILCLIIGDVAEYFKFLGTSLFFVVILPTVATYYFSMKLGRKDGDIPDRTLRWPPMVFGIVSYCLGTIVLYAMDAPIVITVLMLCYAVVTEAMMLITFYWKISIHAVGVMGPTMALAYTFWPWGLLFILALPPIVWSRYVLKKHTPAQLAGGIIVGVVITSILFWLLL